MWDTTLHPAHYRPVGRTPTIPSMCNICSTTVQTLVVLRSRSYSPQLPIQRTSRPFHFHRCFLPFPLILLHRIPNSVVLRPSHLDCSTQLSPRPHALINLFLQSSTPSYTAQPPHLRTSASPFPSCDVLLPASILSSCSLPPASGSSLLLYSNHAVLLPLHLLLRLSPPVFHLDRKWTNMTLRPLMETDFSLLKNDAKPCLR